MSQCNYFFLDESNKVPNKPTPINANANNNNNVHNSTNLINLSTIGNTGNNNDANHNNSSNSPNENNNNNNNNNNSSSSKPSNGMRPGLIKETSLGSSSQIKLSQIAAGSPRKNSKGGQELLSSKSKVMLSNLETLEQNRRISKIPYNLNLRKESSGIMNKDSSQITENDMENSSDYILDSVPKKYSIVDGVIDDGSKSDSFISKFLLDCELINENSNEEGGKGCAKIEKCMLFAANNRGFVYLFDLRQIFQNINIPFIQHANTRHNYNAFRVVKTNFN